VVLMIWLRSIVRVNCSLCWPHPILASLQLFVISIVKAIFKARHE